jgi:hypothetical protein
MKLLEFLLLVLAGKVQLLFYQYVHFVDASASFVTCSQIYCNRKSMFMGADHVTSMVQCTYNVYHYYILVKMFVIHDYGIPQDISNSLYGFPRP